MTKIKRTKDTQWSTKHST